MKVKSRSVLGILLAVFAVYAIIVAPQQAADAVLAVFTFIGDAVTSIFTFFDALLSR